MLVGRDAESAELAALLEAARGSKSSALVIRGEPGVGKTALLEDARARAEGMEILVARGVESESELPFAGLHQLLRPALHLLERLPPPQSSALRGALGLADTAGSDRFLISAACLSLLSELAEAGPVLCIVDDVQWMDAPSVDALLFSARRLDAEGVVLLFAARAGDGRALDGHGLQSLDLNGLDADEAAELLSRHTAAEVADPVRALLVRQAAGNALALVELPTALTDGQLAGEEPIPDVVPLTPDVERLFYQRVRTMTESTQQLLVFAAVEARGDLAPVLKAARKAGIDAGALGPAETAGLLRTDGTHVTFRHPLVRSAIYLGLDPSERRAAHSALADVLTDEDDADQRSWHRAAALLGPDAEVADDLERTAGRAQLRGGHATAARALERSAELSVDPRARRRRLVSAATSAWRAGQPAQALNLADRARPGLSDAKLVADLDHVRGDIEQRRGSLLEGGTILLDGASRAASVDRRKALEMLFDAASCGMQSGDYSVVVAAGQQAAALSASDDEVERFLADLLTGVGSLWLDSSTRQVPLVLDVIDRADQFHDSRLLAGAAMGAGTVGDVVREAALLKRAVSLARETGAADALTLALLAVAVAGVLAGRLAVTTDAEEGFRLARESGLTSAASLHQAILVWAAALKGEDESCRESAAEVAHSTARTSNALAASIAIWGLALRDLIRGRPDDARTRLAALREAPIGASHPLIVLMSSADLVEASIRTDDPDGARAAHGMLEGFIEDSAPSWALALAARCRALLTDGDQAEEEFHNAVQFHRQSDRPFDLARTELLFGEHLRRQRRRTDSRDHLRIALDTFESIGAAPWADRARIELRASGETARKRDPSSIDQLTPQEIQVARLVGEGLSNKEVAAQLFLSPRTIDSHLRNVFAKLQITSRTHLARLSLGEPAATAPTDQGMRV
jgi:DNA-binding CsgD family transcriptional regulator